MKLRLILHSILLAGILPFISIDLSAQTNLQGYVKDINNTPLIFANVLLKTQADSMLVQGTITDSLGHFSFKDVADEKYILNISLNNYQPLFSKSFSVTHDTNEINAGDLILIKGSKDLAGVTVISKKPLFEQKIDRMVINVRNSITSAGGNALEVLEKSPGVVVNRQSNTLSIAAKSGVVIMINGKVTNIPSTALFQMLEGMSAGNIERIELITTPPANFDAEGNAGYINIVLINNPNTGLNGSYAVTAGYGKGDVGSANINFNYRKNKVNLYGDLSYSRKGQDEYMTNYRLVDYDGVITTNYTTTNRHPLQQNTNARLGMDYQATKKTVIGFLISGYNSKWTMDADNNLSTFKDNIADTALVIKNHELNQWKNFMGNINMQHNFSENKKLSFDVDYLYYKDNNPNTYTNKYYDGTGTFLYNERTRTGKVTPIKTWVGKIDYTTKPGKKVNIETGIKGTTSNFTNTVDVSSLKSNFWVPDEDLSAMYVLNENIIAAYLSGEVAIDSATNAKFGLRYEYTNSNLGTATEKNIVDRHYGKLFPSFFIAHKINANNAINFAYSKRIARPSFNDLAPFTIFLDPKTFFTGNPALQPSFTNEVKADYTYKKYILSVAYAMENNSIAEFQPKIDIATNKQYVTAENLDNVKTFTASLSLPFDVTKWWSIQSNFIGAWQQVNALYNKTPLRLEQLIFNFNASMNFTLPKDYSMELSGFYDAGGIYGRTIYKALGGLSYGIQKKFKGNAGKLRFSVRDIFNSILYKDHVDLPQEHFYTSGTYDFSQRTFKLTYTRNFGKNSIKGTRERSTASEEERQRVKN